VIHISIGLTYNYPIPPCFTQLKAIFMIVHNNSSSYLHAALDHK